jgi:hypothetical protein
MRLPHLPIRPVFRWGLSVSRDLRIYVSARQPAVPLMAATSRRLHSATRLDIEAQRNLEVLCTVFVQPSGCSSCNSRAKTPLLVQDGLVCAAADGHQGAVLALIKEEVNINAVDHVWKNEVFLVCVLISNQHRISGYDDSANACKHSRTRSHGKGSANRQRPCQHSGLGTNRAASFHTLNVIYQCGFLQQGLTALIWATLKGHAGIVQMLIDFGADPNMRTYDLGWEHQPTSRVRSSSHPLIGMLFNEVCFHDRCFGRKRTQRSCSQQPTDMWTLCVFF